MKNRVGEGLEPPIFGRKGKCINQKRKAEASAGSMPGTLQSFQCRSSGVLQCAGMPRQPHKRPVSRFWPLVVSVYHKGVKRRCGLVQRLCGCSLLSLRPIQNQLFRIRSRNTSNGNKTHGTKARQGCRRFCYPMVSGYGQNKSRLYSRVEAIQAIRAKQKPLRKRHARAEHKRSGGWKAA